MYAPRKARPPSGLWSDHGCVLLFSTRGACDRWCRYYKRLVLYFHIPRIPIEDNFVRMLGVREICIHSGVNCAMPTTHTGRGYYQQHSGSSRWLMALESTLCRHSDYGLSTSLSHASPRERNKGKMTKREKNCGFIKNGLTSMKKH